MTAVPYVAIAILALVVAVVLVFFVTGSKAGNRLRPLAGVAFAFILAGILFGEQRLIGYGLMGVGIVFAVVDIFQSRKK